MSMRLLAVSLLTLSLAACADIDKSLYDLSNTVAPQDRVTGQRSLSLSGRASQIENSNQQTRALLQKNYVQAGKPINEQVDAAQYARLQRIFSRIHTVSHLADEQWTAYLLPDKEWNAFTAGGTEIFVYKGLMDEVKSDDELAAVIGHEIAHVTANHIYEQQAYTLASMLQGSDSAKRDTFQAAYSVVNENEADQVGILYSALAGYDPAAAARVWQRMYNDKGDYSLSANTHPLNSQRYQNAQQLAAQYRQYYMPGRINPDHAAILASFSGGGFGSQMKPGEGAGLLAVLETAADTYGKRNAAKAEEAAQAQNRAAAQIVMNSLVISRRGLDPQTNTLHIEFGYKGAQAMTNVNMAAKAGTEVVTYTLPGVLRPGATATAQFPFKSARLSNANINNVQIGVVHAQPR